MPKSVRRCRSCCSSFALFFSSNCCCFSSFVSFFFRTKKEFRVMWKWVENLTKAENDKRCWGGGNSGPMRLINRLMILCNLVHFCKIIKISRLVRFFSIFDQQNSSYLVLNFVLNTVCQLLKCNTRLHQSSTTVFNIENQLKKRPPQPSPRSTVNAPRSATQRVYW